MSPSPGQQLVNEGFQFVVASLFTLENVLFALGTYVVSIIIFLIMAKWYWGAHEQTELLKQIEKNTRPKGE